MKYFFLFAFFGCALAASVAYAQCSDGGVCEISRHDNSLKEPRLLVDLGYNIGTSGKPENIGYQQVSAGVEYHLTKGLFFIVDVPFRVQTFSNTSISGFGDMFVMGKYSIISSGTPNPEDGAITDNRLQIVRDADRWAFQAGVKLPTGAVNEDSLPTTYQNGLGTTDLLFGIQYSKLLESSDITGGIGMQIPFGKSANTVDHLERGPSLLLQAAYKKTWTNFAVMGELLGILPLRKSVINETVLETSESSPDPYWTNIRTEVPTSDRLQINALLSSAYFFNESSSIEIGIALPLLKRDHNEDGLKRAFTFYTTIRQGIF